MSKIDDIFKKLGQESTDKAVTVTWTDKAVLADVKQEIRQLILELIGADEPSTSVNKNYRNELRAELRAKVEAL